MEGRAGLRGRGSPGGRPLIPHSWGGRPLTPHPGGGRGPSRRTPRQRGPRAGVPQPGERCPPSFQTSDVGRAPILLGTRGPRPPSQPPEPAAAARSPVVLPKRLPDASAFSQASSGPLGHLGELPGLRSRPVFGGSRGTARSPYPMVTVPDQDSSRAPRFPQDEVHTLQQGSRAGPDAAPGPSGDSSAHLLLPGARPSRGPAVPGSCCHL